MIPFPANAVRTEDVPGCVPKQDGPADGGCPGSTGIADDMVVYAEDEEQHDWNLHASS